MLQFYSVASVHGSAVFFGRRESNVFDDFGAGMSETFIIGS